MSMAEGQARIRAANQDRLFIFLSAILWSLAGVFIKSLDLEPLSTFVGGGMILLGLGFRYRSALFKPRGGGAEENR